MAFIWSLIVADRRRRSGGAVQRVLAAFSPHVRFIKTSVMTIVALTLVSALLVGANPTSAHYEPSSCADGGAVADAANNPGLVSDCDVLLAARDTLAGSATLNWAADRPIGEWEGVTVAGSPMRVAELILAEKGLAGEIPQGLSALSELRQLWLYENSLKGEIPAALSSLSSLQILNLAANQLIGEIPSELGSLPDLISLGLYENQLNGHFPA